MIKFSKADASISTATLSEEEEMSQEPLAVDLLSHVGTPFANLFNCCMPRNQEKEADIVKDPREVPVEMIETVYDEEASECEGEKPAGEPTLFDAGLIFQMAFLGGVLVAQAMNVV